MTHDEFNALGAGDIVQNVSGSPAVMVTDNYGGRVTAVRILDLTNPSEWVLLRKVTTEPREQHADDH